MICKKDHRYNPALQELKDCQAGIGRHICAGCAYEKGFSDGCNGKYEPDSIENLPESQAGTGRHKDAYDAYQKGYEEGKKKQEHL